MVIINLILFLMSLAVLVKCSDLSVKYSAKFARIFNFPEFIISFFIVAFISVLPEGTISIISALNGEPGLGFGTLIGSNVADLTFVLGVVVLFSLKGISVKSKILKNNYFYLVLLLLPLALGFDGRFSRFDGAVLLIAGSIFLMKIYSESKKNISGEKIQKRNSLTTFIFLFFSVVVILISAFYTVKFAVAFASDIKLPAIFIGLTILALGTCLPELIFSIKAVRRNHDSLALGDILGTVITDATLILGLVALISPFSYHPYSFYMTGTAMFLAGILLTFFMLFM